MTLLGWCQQKLRVIYWALYILWRSHTMCANTETIVILGHLSCPHSLEEYPETFTLLLKCVL
jgi:hypothetical protein